MEVLEAWDAKLLWWDYSLAGWKTQSLKCLPFALLRKWQWLQLIMVLNFLNPFESFEQESSNDRPIVSNRNRKRKRRWLVLYFPMKYIWFLCYRQYTRTIERGCFRNKWSRSRLWAKKNHHKQDLLLTAKIGC